MSPVKRLALMILAITAFAMAACTQSAVDDAPECAVYAEVLRHIDAQLDSVDAAMPVIIAANSATLRIESFPQWHEWRPVDGVEFDTEPTLHLEAFTPLNTSGRIDCELADLDSWFPIRGETGIAGWMRGLAPNPLSDATFYAELKFSPVYLSEDGRIAMLSFASEFVGLPSNEGEIWIDYLPGPFFFRLERAPASSWVVSGER